MNTHWLAIAILSLSFTGLASLNSLHAADTPTPAQDQTLIDQEPTQRRSVRYDELPGPVKQTVGQQMGQQDQITVTNELTYPRGRTVYSVRIVSPDQRARNVYVDPSGKLIAQRNVTLEGRKRVDIDDLPGPVKNTLLNEAKGQSFQRITQVTQDDRTWFVAVLNDDRTIRVDARGNLIPEKR